jgi:hypothetical protein
VRRATDRDAERLRNAFGNAEGPSGPFRHSLVRAVEASAIVANKDGAMSTRLWARILGAWSLLAVVGMVANRQTTIAAVNAFFADPALMWAVGIFTVLVGIVIVLTHNRWSGGLLPVVVTLYGWLVLVKGLTFVWLPASAELAFYTALRFSEYFYVYFIVSLAIGAYLTFGGFKERG